MKFTNDKVTLQTRLKAIENDIGEIKSLFPKTYGYGGPIFGPSDPILTQAASHKEVEAIDRTVSALLKHLKVYTECVFGETHTEIKKRKRGLIW